MKEHHLKTATHHFMPALFGVKQAEVRYDDRDYQEGDLVYLYEVDTDGNYMTTKPVNGIPTALNDKDEPKYVKAKITHILRDFGGLSDGYCMLSLEYLDVGSTHKEDALLDALLETDTSITLKAFIISRAEGISAIKGAVLGFQKYIQEANPHSLAASNIMYRRYIVGLMQRVTSAVSKEYHEDVARAFLLPASIQTKDGYKP